MIVPEHLETFLILVEERTMVRAATRLRVTQSTISKRIRALEENLGEPLLIRVGRNFKLSVRGAYVASLAGPLLSELKGVFTQKISRGQKVISLSVSSGLIVSWAPKILRAVEKKLPGIRFQISTYSATVSVDRVRSGDHMLALCHGAGVTAADLVAVKIFEEEMVVIPSDLSKFSFPNSGVLRVIGPEEHSESWQALRYQILRAQKRWGFQLEVERSLVSFAGTVQLAKAGFDHGLVPSSVATALGVATKHQYSFPRPGLRLAVNLVGRKRGIGTPETQEVIRELKIAAERILP